MALQYVLVIPPVIPKLFYYLLYEIRGSTGSAYTMLPSYRMLKRYQDALDTL